MFERLLKAVCVAVVVVLVKAYLFSQHTSAVTPSAAPANQTLRQEVASAPVHPAAGYGRVELRPDRAGQYHAAVEIDGRRLPMLVDTGASVVALTYADAASIGIRPMPSDFKIKMLTANGVSASAPTRLREVRLDTLLVDDVPAIVMPEGLPGTSLLGMSFLKKLGGFEITGGNLMLKP